MPLDRSTRTKAILAFSGAFAFLWILARAYVQSVTIDEADTYLAFVHHPENLHWFPGANNHVLNTLLIRLFTTIFGVHHLSLRAPALIGAAIYIGAAYYLSSFISARLSLQWGAFACLVFCPFVQDYLVAARGYGLATAFVLAAIAVVAGGFQAQPDGEFHRRLKTCALCSALLGLSFAANFSFAFVDAATLAAVFVWACRFQNPRMSGYLKTLAACVLPGLAVTLFFCSSVLLHWPKGQLIAGASSLPESLQSIVSDVFYQPNPRFVDPMLLPFVQHASDILWPALAIFYIGCIALLVLHRRRLETQRDIRLLSLGLLTAVVIATTFLAHWVAFQVFGVLLPKDRTGVYFASLVALSAAFVAAVEIRARMVELFRRGLVVTLICFGIYFLLCLRLTHFKEWDFDADVQQAYWVLAYYNHKHGVRDAVAGWWYGGSLKFYEIQSGHETFRELIQSDSPFPSGKSIYVINSFDEEFIRREGLKVVYRSDSTYLVVAVRPEIDAAPVKCDCGEQ